MPGSTNVRSKISVRRPSREALRHWVAAGASQEQAPRMAGVESISVAGLVEAGRLAEAAWLLDQPHDHEPAHDIATALVRFNRKNLAAPLSPSAASAWSRLAVTAWRDVNPSLLILGAFTARPGLRLWPLLRQLGQDINTTLENGQANWLTLAAREGQVELVRALLEDGALANWRDHYGGTALHAVASLSAEALRESDDASLVAFGVRRLTEVVNVLGAAGADLSLTDYAGRTAGSVLAGSLLRFSGMNAMAAPLRSSFERWRLDQTIAPAQDRAPGKPRI